ncbi:MAG: YCF48-related protein [Sandaracinus sp.]
MRPRPATNRPLAVLGLVLAIGCGARPAPAPSGAPTSRAWSAFETGTTESFRGLALPAPGVIWASGTHGTWARSVDGGAHVEVGVVPGAETLDFRSLHAWSAERAIVLSAGDPGRAFVTDDGGAHWTETLTRSGEGVFFDSLAFDGEEGLALGDPLPSAEGPRFVVLRTHDGGRTWQDQAGPIAEPGEAAFAASNACIAALGEGRWRFATGGAAPRIFATDDDGAHWQSTGVALPGSASAGIFAIALEDAHVGYAIGGDYAAPTASGSFARTHDGDAHWEIGAPPPGYRSSIAIDGDRLVAVGTSGSDLSTDEGAHWQPIDDRALNVVRAADGVVIAAGPDGTIARLVP